MPTELSTKYIFRKLTASLDCSICRIMIPKGEYAIRPCSNTFNPDIVLHLECGKKYSDELANLIIEKEKEIAIEVL